MVIQLSIYDTCQHSDVTNAITSVSRRLIAVSSIFSTTANCLRWLRITRRWFEAAYACGHFGNNLILSHSRAVIVVVIHIMHGALCLVDWRECSTGGESLYVITATDAWPFCKINNRRKITVEVAHGPCFKRANNKWAGNVFSYWFQSEHEKYICSAEWRLGQMFDIDKVW